MKERQNTIKQKLVSAIIIWCMVVGGLFSMSLTVGSSNVPEPEPMDLIPEVIDELVPVINAGVKDVDHNITITTNGTLLVVNTTLNFLCDANGHSFHIDVNDGSLILQNSTITTGATMQVQWDPTFDITLTDSYFEMREHSALAFPGLLSCTNTEVYINDSWITSIWPDFRTDVWASDFTSYLNGVDDNWWYDTEVDLDDSTDDGPILVFRDCDNVTIADSRIDEVVENANFPDPGQIIEHFLPIATLDGLGTVNALWYNDSSYYTIPYTPIPQELIIDGFDTGIYDDANYNVISVDCHSTYRTSLDGIAGYNGTDYLVWQGGGPQNLFRLGVNSIFGENTTTLGSIPTLADISSLNITFENDESDGDDEDNVDFNLIELIVTLEPDYPYYPTMITLDNTEMTMINTYVGVDWLSFSDEFQTKNAFNLTNDANLYLYNVSMDAAALMDVPTDEASADYVPYIVETGSEVYNFKWAEVPVIDRYNAAVVGANVSASSRTANYYRAEAARANSLTAGADQFVCVPNLIHATDTTGQPLANLTDIDLEYYNVSTGDLAYVDGFDVSGLRASDTITDVVLEVQYRTNAIGGTSGYDGADNVNWALEDGTASGNAFGLLPDADDTLATLSLFALGVNDIANISSLNVTFSNTDTEPAYFDSIILRVSYTIDDNKIWANQRIIDYMNRTQSRDLDAANYTLTDENGYAYLPLLSELINNTCYPNGDHVGEYDIDVQFTHNSTDYFGHVECDFIPFPNQEPLDNLVTTEIVQLDELRLPRDEFAPGLIYNDGDSDPINAIGGSLDYCYILVEDDAQLTISNADLTLQQMDSQNFEIRVRGNGQLTLDTVALTTDNNFMTVFIEENGSFTLRDSTSSLFVNYLADDDTDVSIYRSTVSGHFDVTAPDANVTLIAEDTIFARSLDDFSGTSYAELRGVSSPLSPNFLITPSDDAMVEIYRRVNVNVLDGADPGNPLSGATVNLFGIFGSIFDETGTSDATGLCSLFAQSDRITPPIFPHTDPTVMWVGGYDVTVTFLTETNDPAFAGLAAYPAMGSSDAYMDLEVKLDGVLPNLDPPIWVVPDNAGRGTEFVINAIVNNSGISTAYNVPVVINDIFDGDTTTIYTETIPVLAPGGSWPISFSHWWNSTDDRGIHNITILVDPNFVIEELDDGDNNASTFVTVAGAIDLAFRYGDDITFSPANIVVNSTFTINARVHNIGDLVATDVDVVFRYDNASGDVLGWDTIDTITAGTYETASFTVDGATSMFNTTGYPKIFVEIDPNGTIPEIFETNNNYTQSVYIRPPSDIVVDQMEFLVGGIAVTETMNRTTVAVRVRVRNTGGMSETNVDVRFYDGTQLIGMETIGTLAAFSLTNAEVSWVATCSMDLMETHTITAIADPGLYEMSGLGDPNTNTSDITIIDDRPDLRIRASDIELNAIGTEVAANSPFSLNVTVSNNGINTVTNFTIFVYDGEFNPLNDSIGNVTVSVLAGGGASTTAEVDCAGILGIGTHDLTIVVDPEFIANDTAWGFDLIGDWEEYDEDNNQAVFSLDVIIPDLMILITIPSQDAEYVIGDVTVIQVMGRVVRTSDTTQGEEGIELTVRLVHQGVDESVQTVTTVGGGLYRLNISMPGDAGAYEVHVATTDPTLATAVQRDISVASTSGEIPWLWIILIIIIIIIVIVAITLYLTYAGLGKTVQCGECGAYIPEGAKKCPKCGVEFETEIAKCSVCSAWVPIDVKTCPDCGTEFTVGMVELEDYETKMKRQYDQVVSKFRMEAKKDIGDKFTETEFQAWWAAQATFITFDQWLKEEEEMKRMGSKPCPACGMENSVTAKICHKCGSLMGEEEPPKKPEVKKPPAEEPKVEEPEEVPAKVEEAPREAAVSPAPVAAAPVAAAVAPKPEKKKCPSCGMEVAVTEKTCPICTHSFEGKPPEEKPPESPPGAAPEPARPVKKVVKKPVKKIVRRPVRKEG